MERKMKLAIRLMCVLGCCAAPVVVSAQTAVSSSASTPPTVASVLATQLHLLESQFVPAAEAMPEDRYSFAGKDGEFTGTRTFALEIKHVATANLIFYSAILGEAPPPGVNLTGAANGPDDVQTKDQIVRYLKDSFALGHRAVASLAAENLTVPVPNPPIGFMNTRLALATFSIGHAWDHYGQLAEYLRMNGIVPPASKGQPPANPARR
jgi:hypothetical protein